MISYKASTLQLGDYKLTAGPTAGASGQCDPSGDWLTVPSRNASLRYCAQKREPLTNALDGLFINLE
jgi:hypothetical protein